jgi:type II secretory pathway component PulM
MKTLLVALLMHLYPRAWRAEYGAELERMLLARRLGAAVTIDVAASAAWQRMRAIEASAVAGIGLMLVTIAVLVWNVMAPPSYASFSERIGLLQRPMRSELYVLVIAVVGFWRPVVARIRQGAPRFARRSSARSRWWSSAPDVVWRS